MNEPKIFIEGLSQIECKSLQKSLKDEQVPSTIESLEQARDKGKQYEFISTTTIVFKAASLAIHAFIIWWRLRPGRKKKKFPRCTVELPAGSLVSFEEDGTVSIRVPNASGPIRINGKPKAEDLPSENMETVAEILEDFGGIFEELEK